MATIPLPRFVSLDAQITQPEGPYTIYRQMAERLGDIALTSYDQVFALEPA